MSNNAKNIFSTVQEKWFSGIAFSVSEMTGGNTITHCNILNAQNAVNIAGIK